MNRIKKFQKSSPGTYLMISLIVGAISLFYYFSVLPNLLETPDGESQALVKTIKGRFLNGLIGGLTLIFLINLYFWRIAGKFAKEEEGIQKNLNINPNNPVMRAKLRQIERKRNFYEIIFDLAFRIILGLMVAYLVYSILSPLYRGIGTNP